MDFCACFSNIFFTKKPVAVLQNVGWFLRLILSRRFGDPYRKLKIEIRSVSGRLPGNPGELGEW